VEEAMGYKSLIDNFGLTQEQVSEQMGKSRSAVTNALRLLKLKDDELEALRSGKISAGHARALLSCDEDDKRKMMLVMALGGASVRELEKMASKKAPKAKAAPKKDRFYEEVELSLKQALHRKINIKSIGKEKGTITLEFYSKDELADFARRLAGEK
ncbi:MAG: stage 0 sporulation protein J, partial [Clostridia bacterium]|nr:stage 0 sporulation protein J [Clostridia bacterium]